MRSNHTIDYLPQLDGLRFFAFFFVFFAHTLQVVHEFSLKSFVLNSLENFGWMGVDLFFCLSSFLITRLLVVEKETMGHISIPKFLMRRILRIWPAYYFILLLGFVVFPLWTTLEPTWGSEEWKSMVKQQLPSLLLFYNNFNVLIFGYPKSSIVSPLWSISIEEQFYMSWPFLLTRISNKTLVLFIGLLFVLEIPIRYLTWKTINQYWLYNSTFCRLDAILLGMLLAFTFHHWHKKIDRYLKWIVFAFVCVLTFILSHPSFYWPGPWLIYIFSLSALLSALSLVLAIEWKWAEKIMSLKPIVYLGKISYGLYLYHKIAIFIVIGFWGTYQNVPEFFVILLSALVLTMVFASLSYDWIEKPFLKLKKRWTLVQSR